MLKKFLFILIFLGTGVLILTSCATTPVKPGKNWYDEEVERLRIVKYAEKLVGVKDLKKFGPYYKNDCSGFVTGVYKSLGYRIKLNYFPGYGSTLSRLLFANLRRYGLIYFSGDPRRADLVFFKGTIKSYPNRITHVGLVDDIINNNTIIVIHYGSKGVAKLRMNLKKPHVHIARNGVVINDFIIKRTQSRSKTHNLAAEHFAGFGDLYSYCSINNE